MTTMNKAVKGTKNQIEKLFYTPDESDEFIQKLKATNDISKIASFLLLINLGLRKVSFLHCNGKILIFKTKQFVFIKPLIRAN